eukprot:GHVP01061043.1.p2 GENE.GHVP01061043.1~~GHVP01061043.1.p2  ORF type:complete len:442 (-),score=78.16 GHVP01061043.1:2012-3337(-)
MKQKGNYSHIKGIDNLIGLDKAKQAMKILKRFILTGKMAGKIILIVGPTGTGKTTLSFGLSKELSTKPFIRIAASEIFSCESKKTEVISSYIRKSIGISITNASEIYEGEVSNISYIKNSFNEISNITLILKSLKGSKSLKLDPSIHYDLLKENIKIGDIIYIDSSSGEIKKLGRSESYSNDQDIELETYLPIPKANIQKSKKVVHNISLNDLDLANAYPKNGNDSISIINKIINRKKSDISEKLKKNVNDSINNMVKKGLAEINPGILFIDEAHILDLDCFSYLNRISEMETSPTIILSTSGLTRGDKVRGDELSGLADRQLSGLTDRQLSGLADRQVNEDNTNEPVRGQEVIPRDMLDRMIIIKTEEYGDIEKREIIKERIVENGLKIEDEGLDKLVSVANLNGLRNAILLLGPLSVLSKYGETMITAHMINDVSNLYT